MWIITYQAYGTWKVSGTFETEAAAIRHRDLYIKTKEKDYNVKVRLHRIEEYDEEA